MNIERARKELAAEIRRVRHWQVAGSAKAAAKWKLDGLRFAARLLRREKPIGWEIVYGDPPLYHTQEDALLLTSGGNQSSERRFCVPVYESDRIEEQP